MLNSRVPGVQTCQTGGLRKSSFALLQFSALVLACNENVQNSSKQSVAAKWFMYVCMYVRMHMNWNICKPAWAFHGHGWSHRQAFQIESRKMCLIGSLCTCLRWHAGKVNGQNWCLSHGHAVHNHIAFGSCFPKKSLYICGAETRFLHMSWHEPCMFYKWGRSPFVRNDMHACTCPVKSWKHVLRKKHEKTMTPIPTLVSDLWIQENIGLRFVGFRFWR